MAQNKKTSEKKETKKDNKTAEKKETTKKDDKTTEAKKNTKKDNKATEKKETTKKDNKTAETKKNTKNEEKEEIKRKKVTKTEKNSNEEEAKKPKMQLQKKNSEEIQEAVAKEIKANKKLPSSELEKINTRVFQNICLAAVIMFYLNFIILGFINIENSIFVTDLKVFSMVILIVSIGIFEYAYKKDSGRHAVHGIEVLALAFVTIALIYIDVLLENKFIYIVAFITYIFAIYYVAKSIVIYNKMKKEYFVGEMKEIIKK